MHAHTSVTPERNSSAALSALKWKAVCGIKEKKKKKEYRTVANASRRRGLLVGRRGVEKMFQQANAVPVIPINSPRDLDKKLPCNKEQQGYATLTGETNRHKK